MCLHDLNINSLITFCADKVTHCLIFKQKKLKNDIYVILDPVKKNKQSKKQIETNTSV